MVFIFVWNSKFKTPSPMSTRVVSEFPQTLFSARSVSRITKSSVPGITLYDFVEIS